MNEPPKIAVFYCLSSEELDKFESWFSNSYPEGDSLCDYLGIDSFWGFDYEAFKQAMKSAWYASLQENQ